MTFKLQNKEGIQALDPNQIIELVKGNGVLEGLAVSEGTGLELNIASGDAVINGETVSLSADTITLDAADTENARKDLIWIDDQGVIQKTTGEAAESLPSDADKWETASPSPASLNAVSDFVILAEVWVDAQATSITNADIRDRRNIKHILLTTDLGTQLTNWDNDLANVVVKSINLNTNELAVIKRLEISYADAEDSGNLTVDVYDADAEEVLVSTTTTNYETNKSGQGNEIQIRINNNSGGSISASINAIVEVRNVNS